MAACLMLTHAHYARRSKKLRDHDLQQGPTLSAEAEAARAPQHCCGGASFGLAVWDHHSAGTVCNPRLKNSRAGRQWQ